MEGTFEDMIEDKEAQESLWESEQIYRILVENASETILVEQDSLLRFANPKFSELAGYSPAELISRPLLEIVYPADQTLVASNHRKLRNGEPIPEVYSFRILRKDHVVRWVELRSVLISQQGSPFILDFLTDVTERRQAEDAFREIEERDRLLLENANESIFVLQDGALCFANPRISELTGYSFGELSSKPILEFFHSQDRARVATTARGALKDSTSPEVSPFRIRRKDGTVRWVEVRAVPVSWSGKAATLIFLIDITDHKQAESEILGHIAAEKRMQAELTRSRVQLQRAAQSLISMATITIDTRDPYTAGHQRRVAQLAVGIAQEMGLTSEQEQSLWLAAQIHDLGKIAVPSEILNKPGKLYPVEFQLIQVHPEAGHNMLEEVGFDFAQTEMIYQHHERLDGSGYPRRLKGEEISLEARILAVADVVEAMTSNRPYRQALGIEVALAEIKDGAGRLYDPVAVETCLRLFQEQGFQFKETSQADFTNPLR